LNEMYVEIDPGGPPAAVVPSGGTLPLANTRRPVEIDEVLDHLDDQSRAALTTLLSESDAALAHAPRDLPAGLDATSKVATDLRPVLRELDRRHAELRSLVTSLSAISTAVGGDDRRLTSLASGLDSTLSVVAARSGSLDATLRQLPAFTRRLGSATRSVSALTRQLDPTLTDLQRASGVLPGALHRLKSTVGHLATTVRVARPVVRHARPVVADLRPVSAQLRSALPTLEHTTGRLDPVTALLTRYLPDLGAFVVDTRSLVSLRDANGGILRGLLTINTTSDPSGLLAGLSPTKVKGPKG
ncbi:MAG TPA: MCE family protein, partial [Nocardioides sp.]|nr:MCE family protein [Nocardioides sp.]